jgi:hypothetical protein
VRIVLRTEAGTALRNVLMKLSAPDRIKEAQGVEKCKKLGISMEFLKDKQFRRRLEVLRTFTKDNTSIIKDFLV